MFKTNVQSTLRIFGFLYQICFTCYFYILIVYFPTPCMTTDCQVSIVSQILLGIVMYYFQYECWHSLVKIHLSSELKICPFLLSLSQILCRSMSVYKLFLYFIEERHSNCLYIKWKIIYFCPNMLIKGVKQTFILQYNFTAAI